MKNYLTFLIPLIALLFAACVPAGQTPADPFTIGAIPDQDPELLQRRFGLLAEYLSTELDVPVEYKPVTDYATSVTAFRTGDLDMVWFGGLTGVQARLQVDGAQALVQRSLDEGFTSVFIANKSAGIEPFSEVSGLSAVAGQTLTFGSESSTSGRLMPQAFLGEAGVTLDDFDGDPGFSGSHDVTIDLVEAGTYEVGALNSQVWERRVAEGTVDLDKVQLIFETPTFHDYHWVIRPDVTERYGENFIENVSNAFLVLDINNPDHKEILDLFSAERFIVTENGNYLQIETVAREIGKLE